MSQVVDNPKICKTATDNFVNSSVAQDQNVAESNNNELQFSAEQPSVVECDIPGDPICPYGESVSVLPSEPTNIEQGLSESTSDIQEHDVRNSASSGGNAANPICGDERSHQGAIASADDESPRSAIRDAESASATTNPLIETALEIYPKLFNHPVCSTEASISPSWPIDYCNRIKAGSERPPSIVEETPDAKSGTNQAHTTPIKPSAHEPADVFDDNPDGNCDILCVHGTQQECNEGEKPLVGCLGNGSENAVPNQSLSSTSEPSNQSFQQNNGNSEIETCHASNERGNNIQQKVCFPIAIMGIIYLLDEMRFIFIPRKSCRTLDVHYRCLAFPISLIIIVVFPFLKIMLGLCKYNFYCSQLILCSKFFLTGGIPN